MNKPSYIPIATSAPTVEPHDKEVELPTITAEAQAVEDVEDVEDVELAVTVVASTYYVEGQPYTFSFALPCRGGRSIDVLETPAELVLETPALPLTISSQLERMNRTHDAPALERIRRSCQLEQMNRSRSCQLERMNRTHAAPAFLKVQGVIEIPEGLQSNNSDYGHTTTITRKWSEDLICFYVFYATGWNGFVLIILHNLGLVALLIPHTWVGIALVYYIVCLLFNSTVTTITSSTVDVHVTPFSACHRSQSYALDDETVKEIRCKRQITYRDNGKTTVSYEVHIAREDGSSDRVLVGLKYVEEALFVAQEIERMMSIRDNEKTTVV